MKARRYFAWYSDSLFTSVRKARRYCAWYSVNWSIRLKSSCLVSSTKATSLCKYKLLFFTGTLYDVSTGNVRGNCDSYVNISISEKWWGTSANRDLSHLPVIPFLSDPPKAYHWPALVSISRSDDWPMTFEWKISPMNSHITYEQEGFANV